MTELLRAIGQSVAELCCYSCYYDHDSVTLCNELGDATLSIQDDKLIIESGVLGYTIDIANPDTTLEMIATCIMELLESDDRRRACGFD